MLATSANKYRGLTLSEVVLALGILAFVALTVVGVFLMLLRASAKNREQAMAELLTETLLERATTQGPGSWGVNGQISERLEAVLQEDGSKFFYQVDPLELPKPADAVGESWQVTVTVGWWVNDGQSLESARQGFGNQFVKGVRTMYVREDGTL